jgi:hypothetical protein
MHVAADRLNINLLSFGNKRGWYVDKAKVEGSKTRYS